MDLEAASGLGHFLGGECLIQRADPMRVEVIHNESCLFCTGILCIEQLFYLLRSVDAATKFLYVCMSPASFRFREEKNTAGVIAEILVVLVCGSRGFWNERLPCLVKELIWFLIHTGQGAGLIMFLRLDGQDILHVCGEGCVLSLRNTR